MLKTLPIALAQIKAGNNPESLLNEIRQIVYFCQKKCYFKAFLCYFKAFLGKTSQKVPFFEDSGRCPEIRNYTLQNGYYFYELRE